MLEKSIEVNGTSDVYVERRLEGREVNRGSAGDLALFFKDSLSDCLEKAKGGDGEVAGLLETTYPILNRSTELLDPKVMIKEGVLGIDCALFVREHSVLNDKLKEEGRIMEEKYQLTELCLGFLWGIAYKLSLAARGNLPVPKNLFLDSLRSTARELKKPGESQM